MKQNITVKQLEKLNKKERKKLMKWWNETYIDSSEYPEPLLSIGQMIEFLDDEDVNIHKYWEKGKYYWIVKLDLVEEAETAYKELCDALWEAVKEIL